MKCIAAYSIMYIFAIINFVSATCELIVFLRFITSLLDVETELSKDANGDKHYSNFCFIYI